MLTLSMLVRNSLIFLIIVFTYAVNGLGVSSKLDFDDSESASKVNSNGNFQSGFKIAQSLNYPFTDSIIKINKEQKISDINCRDGECEFTVKPIKKENGNDQVVTKVNVKVETNLKKDDEDDNRNKKTKNIAISDVPIFRGKPDSVVHHYYYTKTPISSTNVPNYRGHSTPRPQSRRLYPQNSVYSITPKPVFIPLTNPTYSTVTFDQMYLPNSMWITHNINGNSKTLRTDFIAPNAGGGVQWGGISNTNLYRPLVATDNNPNLYQWYYPTTQLAASSNIPKKTNDLNKYYNNVRFYLENSFPAVNYPGNVQVQHKGDDYNFDVTKSNSPTDNFRRALHTGNDKKTAKAIDDKLEGLDS